MIPAGTAVFLALDPIDLRCGFHRLSGIARDVELLVVALYSRLRIYAPAVTPGRTGSVQWIPWFHGCDVRLMNGHHLIRNNPRLDDHFGPPSVVPVAETNPYAIGRVLIEPQNGDRDLVRLKQLAIALVDISEQLGPVTTMEVEVKGQRGGQDLRTALAPQSSEFAALNDFSEFLVWLLWSACASTYHMKEGSRRAHEFSPWDDERDGHGSVL